MKLRAGFRSRVLLHGALVVLVMAVLVALGDRLYVNPTFEKSMVHRDAWIAEHSVSAALDDRDAVARELAGARDRVGLELTVYDRTGALVASNVAPALAPPPSAAWASLADHALYDHERLLATGVFRDGAMAGVVVTRRHAGGPPAALVVLMLASCAVASLLVSIALSRSVVRPIEKLHGAVRRFGNGDFSARAALRRGDEIGDLAEGFDQMAARIERTVRAEKQLLANVSHELRTPLARIRVVLELASEGDPARVRTYLAEIAHDLAELERLVDDVITTARLDAGSGARVPLRLETIDPKRLAETSRARFESIHHGRALALRMVRVPDALRCDPVLLRRAIDNLLDNAAKYAPDSRIELTLTGDDDNLAIEVMDLGPGMNEEQAAHAFDPFFRADASRVSTPGVGLGLSIVRRVVEAHGGSIDLETAPGRGTSVTARVPLARA